MSRLRHPTGASRVPGRRRCSGTPAFAGLLVGLLAGFPSVAPAQDDPAPPEGATLEARVDPREATVGERISLTLTLTVDDTTKFEPSTLGPDLGPFTVLGGNWTGPESTAAGVTWVWRGEISAYRTGELELPSLRLVVRDTDGAGEHALDTEPVPVIVRSVLEEADADAGAEIADLKPPASVPPDYAAVRRALIALGLLLLAAVIAWWLHRRYAAKMAAARVPLDPFHRIPPHVWVYGELQQLLEQRLPENGEVERFYRELARILKRYLAGRFRVDLMEQTSFEVPESLRQAGAPAAPIEETARVLEACDRVKFARDLPGPDDWKAVVEQVYRIVDRTKPAEPRAQPSPTLAEAG